jgi:hypothetical protein
LHAWQEAQFSALVKRPWRAIEIVITGIRWEDRLSSAPPTDRLIQPRHEVFTSIPARRITTRAPIQVITAAHNTAVTEIGIRVPASASILDRAIHGTVATVPITAEDSDSEEVSDTATLSGTITTPTTGTTEVIIKSEKFVFQIQDTHKTHKGPAVKIAGPFINSVVLSFRQNSCCVQSLPQRD